MDIFGLIQNIDNTIAELARTQVEDALLSTLDGKALVQLRIQTTGQDSDGGEFAGYSQIYAVEGREKLGYQSGYFDMTRKGEYWRDVKPTVQVQSFGYVRVLLGPTRQDNINKALGQIDKRGNILELSASERKIVLDAHAKRRAARIKNGIGL